ncbi:MAG: 2-oxo acid dehydrogenase subunit E2 [Phycisphaeraceae bacterium]|nr:2-oxo acid dehydrogenase subunit E2 [Phycisphaeraceae bacterium]
MSISIEMPRLSDTMEEGTLVKWRVKVGDTVASGDHLADVETDKATMELQAFDDGTVTAINVEEGQTVPVGQVILVLNGNGADAQPAASTSETTAKPQAERSEASDAPAKRAASASAPSSDGARLLVSPVARAIADEKGIDLSTIQGTGPGGRIIKRDVLQEKNSKLETRNSKPSAPAPATLEGKTIALSNMRKTIARRLVESVTTIPQFTVAMPIDMDSLLDLRQTLNEQLANQQVKLSVSDFVTRAVAVACVQHPIVNSSWAGDVIQQHGSVNVGIAVALPAARGGGLIVPVLRDVQNKGLRQISEETKTIAAKAREAGLSQEEMSGGTITISNLGMFGVTQFTAIINPPQAAILAVGAAIEQPVVRDGQLAVGRRMIATLGCDHRVLDGATAAEYLTTLKSLLESPAALLV